ncbi:MAG: sialate O-acetylesterase [Bacteroidales bacterium]|nr:sialate O-acetylesterase [Bacteroidales bacterium]
MIKRILAILSAVLVLASCGKKQYDVYLFIGQSNMAGRGDLLPEDTTAIPHAFILDGNDEIIPAKAPLNLYSTIRKRVGMQKINPAYNFARTLAGTSGRDMLMVVNARGGSALDEWLKGAPTGTFSIKETDDPELDGQPMPSFYDEAVRRAKIAMEHGELKAIIWHQGCSDSGPMAVRTYMDKLEGFVADLRSDLGVGEEVPFIAGELPYFFSGSRFFNPMIRTIEDHVPNSSWVSAEGCTGNADSLHFSRAGQMILGQRYAEKYLSLTE